jgi:hemoglobin
LECGEASPLFFACEPFTRHLSAIALHTFAFEYGRNMYIIDINRVFEGHAMDSLYQRVGGEAVVEHIVGAMYERILADGTLGPFFAEVDMERQHTKFRAFLNTVLGGPAQRSGIELRAAHSKSVDAGLSHRHLDAFASHLRAALTGAGIDESLTREVMAGIERIEGDVLGV